MDRKVKLISLGVAFPQYSYSQREIFTEMGYPSPFWMLFDPERCGISRRHFCVSLDMIKKLSFQEQQEIYKVEALALAERAALGCIDGRDLSVVGSLTYNSCTGMPPGPTMPHYLSRRLGFRSSTAFTNIAGMGCEGALPGLRVAMNHVMATGEMALAVACELSSLTYYPEAEGKADPEGDYECARAVALFGDGCSCALIGYDDDPRHPAIIDSVVHTDTRYIGELGYTWRNGRLRVRLSRRVPELAAELAEMAVDKVLVRNHLRVENVSHWIIHAAGNTVLDRIRDKLGITEECLRWSRETLKAVGNVSSATVGVIGKNFAVQGKPVQGDYLVMVNLGPGMTAGATLCKF